MCRLLKFNRCGYDFMLFKFWTFIIKLLNVFLSLCVCLHLLAV